MKAGVYIFVVFFLVASQAFSKAFGASDPNAVLAEMAQAIEAINRQYAAKKAEKETTLDAINKKLRSAASLQCKIDLLLAKDRIADELKALEKENTQLKKLVADLSLDKAMLKELVEGKW